MIDLSKLSGANKASGKASGSDKNQTMLSINMPRGTTYTEKLSTYVVVPAVTLPESHAYHAFLSVERWFKVKATKTNEPIHIKATKAKDGIVTLHAPAWVFEKRGLDVSTVEPKAKRQPKAKPQAPETVTPPTE